MDGFVCDAIKDIYHLGLKLALVVLDILIIQMAAEQAQP